MFRILIIDDETDILEFVKYNLSRDGYEVYTACNGSEGLETAVEVRPHLILLDMMMPVMNGVEYFRALNEAGVPASLHIYPTGHHGWGYNKSFEYHDEVVKELSAWLKSF